MTQNKPKMPYVLLFGLIAAYAVGFGLLAVRAYPAHETAGAYDLGNHLQALWYAARGHSLELTLVPEFGPTRFAMHVEPSLFLFAPIFWLPVDAAKVLLWLQAIVMALAGLPLYGLARRRLANDWAPLLLVAALFLLPAYESITLFEFHAVALAPTFLLVALFFLDRALLTEEDRRGIWAGVHDLPGDGAASVGRAITTKWLLAALFFLLALGTKEDISLVLVMLGMYLVLSRRRRVGAVIGIAGLAWFLVATYVVIPGSRPDSSQSAYLGFFSQLGDTPLEILLSPFRSPLKVIALVLSPETVRGLGMLILPLALVPLLGWRLLLLDAPVLAIPLLSANPMMHQLETYHYAAPAITFLMLATVDGVGRSAAGVTRLWQTFRTGRPGQERKAAWANGMLAVSLVVVSASLVYQHFRGYSPLALAYHWPQVTAHERLGDRLAASIPAQAPVLAQAELVPLVAERPWVRIWNGPFDKEAEYVFLDVSHPLFPNRNGAQERLVADMAFDASVGLVASNDGYLLLKRDAPRVPITPEFFTFLFVEPPEESQQVNADFGDALRLTALTTAAPTNDREEEPLVTLYWQALAELDADYFIAIFLLDENQVPVGATLFQQPATVWWPTSRWLPGQNIKMLVNTFPWWTGDRSNFGYGVAVVRGDDPWDITARLPVTSSGDEDTAVDDGTLLPLVKFHRIAGIPYAQ